MFDVFLRLVVFVDSSGFFIDGVGLELFKFFIVDGNKCFDVVNFIVSNVSCIVSDVVVGICCESFGLILLGGGVYIICKMVVCLCDGDIIFCYICYVFLVGDVFVFNDCCLNGLKEIYVVLGVLVGNVVCVVGIMKVVVVVFVINIVF